MSENQDKIDELLKKLDLLINQQEAFSKEINSIKAEVNLINPKSEETLSTIGEITSPQSDESPTTVVDTPDPNLDQDDLKIKAKVFPNSTNRISWLKVNPIDNIKDTGISTETKTTSKGTSYTSFTLIFEGTTYEMCFVEKGKWFLRTADGESILLGLFKNSGTSLQIAKGAAKDSVVQSDSVLANTLKVLELSIGELRGAAGSTARAAEFKEANAVKKANEKSDLEKFIGANLITVIGIIILFIGVVFGVKYSIDHNLINPLTRIMLGYFLGVGVLLVGIKLKKKYEFFSAVLVSGAIAIMYFDTFVAYSLYEIFPQLVAFGLMIFFTIFTVLAAINYNRQIIAHIALVGSYAIPILLSDGSGNVFALFTYMTIINAGILVLGFKKDWKPLYYVAFSATWIIFLIWYVGAPYQTANHFKIGMGYATIFFLLFYVTFLAYKLIKKEQFVKSDIILIILNSTVFYGLCFNMLDRHDLGVHYVGLFTLGTACIHFAVSVILYKTKLADRNLFYLSSGMVLAFLTIAIPVQLSGTWITLLWGIEALVLFWIGRTKGVRVYEFLSYPVMLIAVGGLVMDWLNFYSYNSSVVESYDPLMNLTFLTSLIVCVSLSVILYFNQQARFGEKLRTERPELLQGFTALLTIATIAVVYFTFKLELDLYFNKMYYETKILASSASAENPYFVFNDDIFKFRTAWAINYSLAFCLALLFLNSAKIKSRALSIGALSLSAAVIIIFLNLGLYELSQLTRSYKGGTSDAYFNHGSMSIALRYISYALVAGLLFMMFKGIKDRLIGAKMYFDLFMHTTILWILCAELMNMTDLASIGDQDKLGLSILAGLYAVFLVALGIAKRTAYLRIAAFTVFGITLVKLFFYDLVQLTTISKTIVFIALGVILLIVSFMYNKYKHTFTDEK